MKLRNDRRFTRPLIVKFHIRPLDLLVLLTAIALIAGCGGGGSGATPPPSGAIGLNQGCPAVVGNINIRYTTLWQGSTPSDASQVIQIIEPSGTVVRTESIDRTGSQNSILLSSIPNGIYELRVRLYAQPGAGGAPTGELSLVLDACAPAGTLIETTTVSGLAPQSLRIGPGSVTLTEQDSLRFIATAFAGTGIPTFVAPGGLDLTVSGGIGTISSDGTFVASSSGSGSIQATVGDLTASSQVTVESVQITQGKWTILVFMNAANDLAFASDLNMNQMERVAGNPDVRFVVQWKQSREVVPNSSFDGVRRYLVLPDNTPQIASKLVQSNLVDTQGKPLDMGDPEVLNDFITWGKTFYPADRYVLVLWNHGNGWRRSPFGEDPTRAFSYDDQYGTSIKTWDTHIALGGHSLDIIAWDASLMQMLEVAYETAPFAQYIVGSEESPPAEGYPYDIIFDKFRDNPNASTESLTKAFVDGMLAHPPYQNRKITQSVIRTDRLPNLINALDALGDQLIIHRDDIVDVVQDARQNAQSYSPTNLRFYRDLIDLCEIIRDNPLTPAPVVQACQNVIAAAQHAIVWEGNNNQSPNSNGVSIDFSPGDIFQSVRLDYARLRLAQHTSWFDWLTVAP